MCMCVGLTIRDKVFDYNKEEIYEKCKKVRKLFIPSKDDLVIEAHPCSYIDTCNLKKCKSWNIKRITD